MSRDQQIRHVLMVDDEPDICELVEITLARMGLSSQSAHNLADARQHLQQAHFDLCLTDMRLPDGNGIDLVRHIQHQCPDLPTAVITAHGNMESAIEALKAGAFDFVSKPVDLQLLRNLVQSALRLQEQTHQGQLQLLGDSPIMQQTRQMIARLARSQAPVYISGESGTGKELIARMIHEQGPRAQGPFIPVNCGAIPSELMESEFFGHRKGSFTGAIHHKEGLFQAANGGTLFLDEVAELPMAMQVKLLRAIQERAIRPIGEQNEIGVDVRILCATHKDLAQLVQRESFRQDLYYRLNVIEIHAPALREHRQDIPALTQHYLQRLGREAAEDLSISPEAEQRLRAHPFPGNVRELENILERAATLCAGARIQATDLRLDQPPAPPATPRAPTTLPDGSAAPPSLSRGDTPLDEFLADIERAQILRELERQRWNRTAAAEALGISFRSLRYRLRKLGIEG